jgi:hypothetical protein
VQKLPTIKVHPLSKSQRVSLLFLGVGLLAYAVPREDIRKFVHLVCMLGLSFSQDLRSAIISWWFNNIASKHQKQSPSGGSPVNDASEKEKINVSNSRGD